MFIFSLFLDFYIKNYIKNKKPTEKLEHNGNHKIENGKIENGKIENGKIENGKYENGLKTENGFKNGIQNGITDITKNGTNGKILNGKNGDLKKHD